MLRQRFASTRLRRGCEQAGWVTSCSTRLGTSPRGTTTYLLRGNIYVTPLRFELVSAVSNIYSPEQVSIGAPGYWGGLAGLKQSIGWFHAQVRATRWFQTISTSFSLSSLLVKYDDLP
jgi:hypothetical protein